MFIGHFAVGFASKRAAPRTSLAVLIAAPLLADILWPVFLMARIEFVEILPPGGNPFLTLSFLSYPWSHSLMMVVMWGAGFAGLYYALTRYRAAVLVIFAGVLSHWVLDAVTHRPDMPLTPWTPQLVGLGLWNSVPATVGVESLMFAIGVWVYSTTTRARDRIGRWGWWGLVLLLVVAYAGNVRGTPPPTVTALAWTGIIATVIVTPLAWWLDRHREGPTEIPRS